MGAEEEEMNRRDFLKGMVVAAGATIATPIIFTAAQAFARGIKWELVGIDRNVRQCTNDYLFKRPDPRPDYEQHATISMPWEIEMTPAETLELVGDLYP